MTEYALDYEGDVVEMQGELWEQPFPGYKVTHKIGQGGSGAVFLAKDIRLDRDIAIKTLIPDLEHNEDAVERFFNEARQVARMRHNNIVRGLDVGRSGKYFFFVMEYIRGESVADKLSRLHGGRLREIDTIKIVLDIADALQYIFENGLVHRDIKPGNIILANSGEIKLCDFGVAKEVAYESQESFVMGSPSYVSPEAAAGDPNIDIRADLYSLGCTWYHMLLSRPPFIGESAPVILRKHISDDPVNPTEVDLRITPATGQLLMWLLEKDRDRRPRNPQQFIAKMMTHPLLKLEQERELVAEYTTEEDNSGEDSDL